MVEPLRHRHTKGAETDMPGLPPLRHTSTLPIVAVHLTGCRSRPIGAVVDPDVSAAPYQRRPRLGPMPHQRVGRSPPGFQTAIQISYRGVKLPSVSAALGGDLPAVRGRFAAGDVAFPRLSSVTRLQRAEPTTDVRLARTPYLGT
jgi:hypothetical protein